MTKHSSIKLALHSEIINYISSKEKWGENLIKELPSSWENYNGFVVFSSPSFISPVWQEVGLGIWELICKCLKANSIAIKDKIKNDGFRSPQASLVYGDSPLINYIDNRIKYSWNVEKTMFSSGNVSERHRVASLKCDNEVIVDLFAGIGYFTLPYLVHAHAKLVHACEWNPDAVDSLRRNLHLNRVEHKCLIHFGDNRKVCPKNVANRVNVGLIPSSEIFWKTACEALLPSGGILYIHQNVTSKISGEKDPCETCKLLIERIGCDLEENLVVSKLNFSKQIDYEVRVEHESCIKWKHLEWFIFSVHISHEILDILEKIHCTKWNVSVDEIIKVKSYAPHIHHLVYSVTCKSQ